MIITFHREDYVTPDITLIENGNAVIREILVETWYLSMDVLLRRECNSKINRYFCHSASSFLFVKFLSVTPTVTLFHIIVVIFIGQILFIVDPEQLL